MQDPKPKWVSILDEKLSHFNFQDTLHCNPGSDSDIFKRLPPCYRNILKSWFKLANDNKDSDAKSVQDIVNLSPWFNQNIIVNGKEILWKSWYNKRIRYIADLLSDSGTFLSHS